jgi:hypothetical protein
MFFGISGKDGFIFIKYIKCCFFQNNLAKLSKTFHCNLLTEDISAIMSLHSTGGYDPKLLPNLPGFRSKGIQAGPKKSCFQIVNGQAFLRDEYIPQTQNIEPDDGTSIHSFTQNTINKARKQLAADKQNVILNFLAYFTESVDGTSRPQVRQCNIFFFVEDGSLKIVEKPVLNSGVSQGTLVKRAILNKPDGTPYVEEDLNIGTVITIYGRSFT